ncbi:hypothetical protein ACT8ZV_18865 [Nocardioides sp. MAHUQ-72]|uniref:hypothetical protein n=1 Tax=unclassified Nocardioides TaxID=2615069 RepID=UPI00361002EB
MTTLNHRYPAIQGEYEDEYESELEGEYELEEELEDESFLGPLASIAGSLLGEEEYEAEYELESEYETELEEEFEFEFEAEAEMEMESEAELEEEFEDEAEEEAEGFVNPVRRIYRDAETMAHLAVRAERAQSEAEAEAFVGALVPIAARLIPRAASVLARNAPALIRGATRIARRLRRSPQTRRMVRALPVVLQRTAQSLADQAANGVPIDATTVVRTLGTMTGRVLRQPASPVRAVTTFDRRWQRRAAWNARRRGNRPYRVYSGRPGRGYRRPVARPAVRPVNRRVARRVRRR